MGCGKGCGKISTAPRKATRPKPCKFAGSVEMMRVNDLFYSKLAKPSFSFCASRLRPRATSGRLKSREVLHNSGALPVVAMDSPRPLNSPHKFMLDRE